ncbi:MAG: PcfB family protein [Lachnospiraceae bacterium]|nr:PcfB family protein [Lachnospiraceae bacterium]
MQEEVEQKTVNLVISTTKLTMRTVAQAALKYLNHRKTRTGKLTVGELLKRGQGLVSSIDVAKTDLTGFQKVARKYGIDYAIKKDISGDTPKYLVFFKARDAEAMTAAFNEYTKKSLEKEKRPSVLEQLKKIKELVAEIPGKVMHREKQREQSR